MIKFNKLKFYLRKDKVFCSLFVLTTLVVILDFASVVYNIIEMSETRANSAALSNSFLIINIIILVLNIIMIGVIVILSFIRKK